MNPTWKERVCEEVNVAVERRRKRPEETAADILDTLTVEEFEAEFPLIDLCLREAIRLGLPGMSCRKNLSGRDIPIVGTREVIPNGAFAAYWMDDVSRNPDLYTDPDSFDPGRYLDGRNEDKKAPHGYLGWGAGRHPCCKSRFLEYFHLLCNCSYDAHPVSKNLLTNILSLRSGHEIRQTRADADYGVLRWAIRLRTLG